MIMRIFSYVVDRDYGFAPNPFHGICTLAACKPVIRRVASVGDFVVGITPKAFGNRLCFAMEVDAKVSFDDYWSSPEYALKKPVFNKSYKFNFGDNIYFKKPDGSWHQQNSHHTHEDGTPIQENIDTDTGSTDQVLIGRNFSYWGGSPLEIPPHLSALKIGRGHKSEFSDEFVAAFIVWFRGLSKGMNSSPERWSDAGTFR